jgi:hypothetical protein
MKIGIIVNHVLRNILTPFEFYYSKEFPDRKIKKPFDTENLFNHFEFQDKQSFDKFIEDYNLEIFAFSDSPEKTTIISLNNLYSNLKMGGHELVVLSNENGRNKPATLNFLSKQLCPADRIVFTTNYNKIWNECDVIITAEPGIIKSKPFNKKAILIKTDFLNDSIKLPKSVIVYDNLSQLENMEFLTKLYWSEYLKKVIGEKIYKIFN